MTNCCSIYYFEQSLCTSIVWSSFMVFDHWSTSSYFESIIIYLLFPCSFDFDCLQNVNYILPSTALIELQLFNDWLNIGIYFQMLHCDFVRYNTILFSLFNAWLQLLFSLVYFWDTLNYFDFNLAFFHKRLHFGIYGGLHRDLVVLGFFKNRNQLVLKGSLMDR